MVTLSSDVSGHHANYIVYNRLLSLPNRTFRETITITIIMKTKTDAHSTQPTATPNLGGLSFPSSICTSLYYSRLKYQRLKF